MDIRVIEKTADLKALCERLQASKFIAVDTEFRRQTTYWPELCLIQVAGVDEAAIIDARAPGIDLSPFYALLADESILKVLHAARQDIEIFHKEGKVIPNPLFDTQVAAMVCGFGESVGYETLAVKLAKAKVDKTARFTDWTHRPLSQKQLAYALGDVTHLRVVFEALYKQLEANSRADWLDDEMAVLTDPATYEVDPREVWRRLKTRSSSRRFLGILREVAAWREEQAQSRDVPRSRVMRDDVLLQVAAQAPDTTADFGKIRALGSGFPNSRDAASLMEAITRARNLPNDALPVARDIHTVPRVNPSLVDLLRVLLKMKAEDHGVAQKLIAGSEDLDRLAAGERKDMPVLKGWRNEVFGQHALQLLNGELALTAENDRTVLRHTKV
jgi:ribonuclease D